MFDGVFYSLLLHLFFVCTTYLRGEMYKVCVSRTFFILFFFLSYESLCVLRDCFASEEACFLKSQFYLGFA